jgi:ribonuclease Z
MLLTLLGTGCPSVSVERHGPAQLLRHGGCSLLIDCGSGVTQRLLQAGSSGREIDALLLTHLHSDHLVDLFQLIISSWHQGRDVPQRILGPRGTRRYVDGLMALWRPELEQRVAHERRPSTRALEVEVREFEEGPLLDLDGLAIDAFAVRHEPVENAFGFHCEAAGRRLVVSGDTRRCPAVVEAARGADLLLHEVFVHHDMPVVPGIRTAETVERAAGYHTLSSEVGKIAQEADVGALMLTHFVPPAAGRDRLLAEVSADFAGPVILGEDLMSYDLESTSLTYGQAHLRLAPAVPARTHWRRLGSWKYQRF